ncbi:MAG TPA: AbrB/MazE/SpoVT family DNA-binding domain-containing protein [Gammaproteobacteria bacterium]|jgi:AbrB family looped-hinge helix DNA binding protein|nr:AbrB/MazE/SpoVT family DNA-binding domain-containing protein [Gammaproteobacteria bacterium]
MAKVTSKLQLTIPKRIAEQYGIAPGDEVDLQPAGDIIRLIPPGRRARKRLSDKERLRLFDAATARQREREKQMRIPAEPPAKRDWRREDLYDRGGEADDGESR